MDHEAWCLVICTTNKRLLQQCPSQMHGWHKADLWFCPVFWKVLNRNMNQSNLWNVVLRQVLEAIRTSVNPILAASCCNVNMHPTLKATTRAANRLDCW
jgi:hypothetical protein